MISNSIYNTAVVDDISVTILPEGHRYSQCTLEWIICFLFSLHSVLKRPFSVLEIQTTAENLPSFPGWSRGRSRFVVWDLAELRLRYCSPHYSCLCMMAISMMKYQKNKGDIWMCEVFWTLLCLEIQDRKKIRILDFNCVNCCLPL